MDATGRRAGSSDASPVVSMVVPMMNEANSLDAFLCELTSALGSLEESYEIVAVNDGSDDDTLALLLQRQARDKTIRIVDLSRNFGKEAAVTAGLAHARGAAVIVIDADLQDSPAVLPEMIRLWRDEGFDMVIGRRRSRKEDGFFRCLAASLFVRLHNRMADPALPENAGDFRLLDRAVVDALLSLPERVRFNKGLFAWLGYRQAFVDFDRPARTGGRSAYSYWRLLRFAVDGIASFSAMPLRLCSFLGMAIGCVAVLYAGLIVLKKLYFGIDVPGYASLIVAVLLMGALNLIGIGILGSYLSRVLIEVKQRPLYLVRKVYEPAARPSADRRGSRR